ncbi:MAG: bifunctional transaldolase/phosoglucose isomerase, partial [Candidatus Sulfotelmatobacter sp.]
SVKAGIADWQSGAKMQRLWQRDATLWTGDDEAKWLGWLDITEHQIENPIELRNIAKEVWSAGFKDALLLGMGGSSLCPEVLRKTFGKIAGFPDLHVLDSTDPAQVKAFEEKIDIARTLFIVSSKSGSTLEPNIFKQYFFELTKKTVGADKAGSHFIAITDPGSKLQKVAEGDHFRHIFFGLPTIGGRYSALSDFGMAAAAIMGVDVKKFLDRTQEMVRACGASAPVEQNPGAVLGIILGEAAKSGRDKVTIITSPDLSDLGAWLEQLLAESTGKVGKGIIPVDREEVASPQTYGNDRVFAYIHTDHGGDVSVDTRVEALEHAGHPVLRISMADIYDLGAEFFRWEIATAVAGSIIGINAFNQPDVEASKVETRKLTDEYEKTGSLPAEAPVLEEGGIKLFTDEKNAAELAKAVGKDRSLAGYVKAHLSRIGAGDYFALLGYIEMNDEHEKTLQAIRHAVRDKKHVATCLGFGPRFLHSTGQAYKGGPNSGVFLQITCDDKLDLPVPDQKYTFGIVKAAQARGDFQVLADRGRRALRVHLQDVESGLKTLTAAVQRALG